MNQHILGTTALLLAAATASAQWHQAAPTASPTARSGAGMTYNPLTNSVLLFGGAGGGVGAPSNQTWSYDGTTWSLLTPAVSPTGKAGMELVYDSNRSVFVMFGSMNTTPFGGASVNQHWEYDGLTTWTQIFPTTTPGGRGSYGACFDSVRNRVVLYGGIANSMFPIAESGTWEFDGTNWASITTVGNPGPLERPAMCFHHGIGKTVMFGGINPQIGGVDTTWLYDGATWVAAAVSGPKPAVRTGAKMVYDSVRNVCVLTGGVDPTTGNAIIDTWEFNGTSWTQIQSATTGRYASALAYVPTRQCVVQFGGVAGFTALGDTWEYTRARVIGTGCPGTNGVPALDAAAAPRLGQNYVQDLTNLNPAIGLGLLVLSLTQIAPTPLDVIGMTGCYAYVTPDVLVTMTAVGSSASFSLSIPSTPSLVGTELLSQGISVDPVNPAWLVSSNALGGLIGQ